MDKFDKRFKLENILSAIIWGLSGATLSGGAIAGISILAWKNWIWWIILIISLSGALFFGCLSVVFYYISHKTSIYEKALRIDEAFHTQEKIVTREHYKDKQGVLIERQREDANKILQSLNPKKMPIKVSMCTIPALILGIGLCCTSFSIVPTISEAMHQNIINDSIENIDNKTEELIEKIENKIEGDTTVEDEEFKAELQEILEELEESLEGDNNIDSRQEKINEAKEKMDSALEKANNKEGVSEEQKEANQKLIEELKEEIDELASLQEEDEFTPDEDEEDENENNSSSSKNEGDEENNNSESKDEKTNSNDTEEKTDETGSNGSTTSENAGDGLSTNGRSDGSSTENEGGSGAGAGTGEDKTRYGDDHIYDSKHGDVAYKDVLDDYYGEAIKDAENSNDDEAQDLLEKYFGELYRTNEP